MRAFCSRAAKVVVLGILVAGLPLLAPSARAFPGQDGNIAFANIDSNHHLNVTAGLVPSAQFATTTDWRQFHFNARHTGFNPHESILTPSNVVRLRRAWRSAAGGARPVVVDGVVYSSGGNQLSALNGNTGRVLWTISFADLVETTPAVMNGRVYVQTVDGIVHALRAATGATMWTAETAGAGSSPTVAHGRVYVGDYFTV